METQRCVELSQLSSEEWTDLGLLERIATAAHNGSPRDHSRSALRIHPIVVWQYLPQLSPEAIRTCQSLGCRSAERVAIGALLLLLHVLSFLLLRMVIATLFVLLAL